MDCDLILAGFIDIVPQILVAARDASVAKRDWFAAVGNGALIAESALYRRQYVPDLGLDEALYRVYEAKKLSEVSPGVGPATHMFIIWALPSHPGLSFVREGYINSTLDPWFKRFGPRKIPALKRHTLDEILINPPEQQSPLETKDDP